MIARLLLYLQGLSNLSLRYDSSGWLIKWTDKNQVNGDSTKFQNKTVSFQFLQKPNHNGEKETHREGNGPTD